MIKRRFPVLEHGFDRAAFSPQRSEFRLDCRSCIEYRATLAMHRSVNGCDCEPMLEHKRRGHVEYLLSRFVVAAAMPNQYQRSAPLCATGRPQHCRNTVASRVDPESLLDGLQAKSVRGWM